MTKENVKLKNLVVRLLKLPCYVGLISMVYQELPCIKLVGLHFLHIKHNCHVEVRVIKLIKFDMINNFQSCGPLTSAHGWQLNEINQTSYSTVHNIDRCLCNPN